MCYSKNRSKRELKKHKMIIPLKINLDKSKVDKAFLKLNSIIKKKINLVNLFYVQQHCRQSNLF